MSRERPLPWRRVAAALPAVALVGVGAALAATGGDPTTDVVADSRPLVTVPARPLQHLDVPAQPPLPELPAPPEQQPTPAYQPGAVPASMSTNGIPAAALAAYRRAAQLVHAADPACHVDWALVAAIGKVESNHGRYGGNGIDTDGTVRPGIFGIPLDGANGTAVVRDSDGGLLDHDSTWDRAVGPMQFIPGTWRVVGVDANGDGRTDPQNIDDAATATAVYLCSGPGDLSTDSGARSAVLRYNQSDAYADQVLAIAAGYRGGYTVEPAHPLTEAQRSGSPYLPTGDSQTMAHYDPAVASRPAARPAAKPGAAKPSTRGGSGGAAGDGAPGSGGASTGSPTPGTTTGPTPGTDGGSSDGGVVGTVTGVVGGVVGGLTGATPSPTSSTPSPTPTPSPTSTTSLPLTVAPVNGKCPAGYDPVLSVLGVVTACTLHR
jgi:membrane-bound lytic murein transglycosylase B